VNPKPTPSPSPEDEKNVTSEEMPDPTKPVLKAIPLQPGEHPSEGETSEPTSSPFPSETVVKAIKPTGSPVEIRRAIPVVRPTPQASEPEVRRAEPVDQDESN